MAFRVVPDLTRRGLLIGTGIAMTAVIGLSRVYLEVHWLSDVSAGWALGFSCFAAAAVVALISLYIRDNLRLENGDDRHSNARDGESSPRSRA